MPQKIKIRKALRKDIDSIVKLKKELSDFHHSIDNYYKPGSKIQKDYGAYALIFYEKNYKNYLAKIIKKRNIKILVAEKNEKIVGFIIGEIEKANPVFIPKKIGRISNTFIEENYRKTGLGKEMANDLISWFKRNKIKYIELYCLSGNKNGVKFWQGLGFKEFMKRMRRKL